MIRNVLSSGFAIVSCFLLLGGNVVAQDAAKPKGSVERKAEKAKNRGGKKKSEVPPEMQQYMEAMAPGKEHKVLDVLAGNWDAATKIWPQPGAPASESKASSRRRWKLGGRYLREDYRGVFMGMKFQGIGFMGYDKGQKAYVSSWMDNMGTGIMIETGKLSEDGKVLKFSGEQYDAMTGQKVKIYSIMRIESKDKHVAQMYREGPDGNEVKFLEIVYTRRVPKAKPAGKERAAKKKKES